MRELSQADKETAIRILGAADAYAHMMIRLQSRIGNVMADHIPERHVRKLAERDTVLRHLISLREHCDLQHRECTNAYKRRMAGERH